MPKPLHIAIIGNGIAGTTAARHLRKRNSNCRISLISAETEYFFSRTALMYVYMGHMRYKEIKPYEDWFWKKNRIETIFDYVQEVDFKNKTLKLKAAGDFLYDKLLIATGSLTNVPPWEGTHLKGVQGMYSWQDLEELESNTEPWGHEQVQTRHAVIVGGGLVGVELAEMLRTRDIDVSILVRDDRYWGDVLPEEEARMVEREIERHGARVLTGHSIEAIEEGKNGRVGAVRTTAGKRIECDLVGISTGVRPNIGFLENSGLETNRGIMVNHRLETNFSDVFAAGDCAQISEPLEGHLSIEPVWYTGRMMGEVAAANLAGKPEKYLPGPWFNSAKFFHIEYQTYGRVPPEADEAVQFFTWHNEKDRKMIKVAFQKNDHKLLGINLLNVRVRHEKFDGWLSEGLSVEAVFARFWEADFQTEFTRRHYGEMIAQFNEQFNRQVKLRKRKKGLKLAFWR